MDLRDYYNILFLVIWSLAVPFAQDTQVRCINPQFDQLVDDYLDYSIPVISVADAYESKDNYVFLDARELEEFNTSHIADAIHVGYDDFDIDKIKFQLSEDTKIVIYCSIGYRSEKIGKILQKNGFETVFNLYGSIFEWVNQHHTIVDSYQRTTYTLHTYNKKWSKWVTREDVLKIW